MMSVGSHLQMVPDLSGLYNFDRIFLGRQISTIPVPLPTAKMTPVDQRSATCKLVKVLPIVQTSYLEAPLPCFPFARFV